MKDQIERSLGNRVAYLHQSVYVAALDSIVRSVTPRGPEPPTCINNDGPPGKSVELLDVLTPDSVEVRSLRAARSGALLHLGEDAAPGRHRPRLQCRY